MDQWQTSSPTPPPHPTPRHFLSLVHASTPTDSVTDSVYGAAFNWAVEVQASTP